MRISALITGLFALAACTQADLGENAPLQLAADVSEYTLTEVNEDAWAEQVANECRTSFRLFQFESSSAFRHYSAFAATLSPTGECVTHFSVNRHNRAAAEQGALGHCEVRGDNCRIMAVVVPNGTVTPGTRTVSAALQIAIERNYLNALGYSAIALNNDGFWFMSTNRASQAAADQEAMAGCQSAVAGGSRYVDAQGRVSSTVFAQPAPCLLVNRRGPDGVNRPNILQD